MSGSVESDKGTNPMDAPDKKDGDEEVESVSGGVGQESHKQEFSDPAILAVGTVPAPAAVTQFRYTREELLKLRTAPSSRIRPDFLDAAYFNNQGVWDPEPWHYNRNPDSTTENGGGGRGGEYEGNHKRRSGDPKERIRKEQDGIVLSPQRRSFNSGCFVPVREPLRPNRPHSPLGGGSGGGGSNGSSLKSADPAHIGSNHRELNSGPGARRIGSGRILPWDFQEKSDVDNDFGYRRDRREADRDDRFERRSFARDFEIPKEKERHIGRSSNNNGRFSNRRISNENKEEEPEWFSSGPMSQNDTIELRGFDDNEKLGGIGPGNSKKKTAAQKKKLKEAQAAKVKETTGGSDKNYLNEDSINKKTVSEQVRSNVPTTTVQEPTVNIEVARVSPQKPEQGGGGDGPHVMPGISSSEASFNFEDILKCDNFPGLLSNGVESGDAAGSRFSRWFQREKSPPQPKLTDGSRRSSLQDHDHHHIIKNLLSDPFNEPSVSIPQPGDSESYFAPISPAASSILPQQQAKGVNLMEMLQRNNKHAAGPPSQIHPEGPPPPLKGIVDVPGPGKILSLEELEARMMQGLDMASGKHQPKSEDDINAFKRLFSQVNTGGLNHHMTNGPTAVPSKPMSIMEMLSHSQQQDEAARLAASQRIGPAAAANLPHIAEMSFKLQQVQNQVQQQKQQAQIDMLQKLMSLNLAQQATRASPLQEMGINQSRELLNRPEAQAILQGLKRGDLTPQHLYQQLANPAMQPRHRDLLLTILKMQVASGGMPQSASPVPPPHHIYQQQLRVSPLPPNAMHQRIPSPRELQVHTQNIMQRALIKKKLEEQEENFRKKQAQQRGTSPAKTASPTPLAFTPTAVLRKMTADKDEGSKDVKGDSKMPQGRPVTGMRTAQPSQQQPQVTSQQSQSWTTQFPQQLKQPGRPIVKANNYQPPTQTQQQQQEQYFQQQRLLQQQRKNQQHQQQSFGNTFSPQGQQQQQFPQLSQQQLRAQHQNVRSQHQQQQPFGQQQQQQPSWTQQMLQGQGFDNRQVGRGGIDGDLSPTSNQLARWFSPDLLDRARKGKVPVIPSSAVTQHALNLEEMDRQTTPVGHN